jgi:hypothetical protein
MRRLLMIAAAVVAVAAAALGMAARPEAHDSFVVDAIFDTAKGIVPGHVVKIAGVRVGKVEDVSLTDDQKALLRLKIDTKFRPFRADATCRILPEGLISENFVDCVPGKAARRLAVGRDGVPTIGIDHTTVPVDLQDVINIFTLPVDQRVRAVINELGLATAGRGEDLNALLRRANPALTATRSRSSPTSARRSAMRSSKATPSSPGSQRSAARCAASSPTPTASPARPRRTPTACRQPCGGCCRCSPRSTGHSAPCVACRATERRSCAGCASPPRS